MFHIIIKFNERAIFKGLHFNRTAGGVISIISLLSSVVYSSLGAARQKARDALRISQINEVMKALDLYYSSHGQYPSNFFPLTFSDEIPHNWATMVVMLFVNGLIQATFSAAGTENFPHFSLINRAYAFMAVLYACSIQDPFYKTADDYSFSYGYVASADTGAGPQSYKIRIYLENSNSPLFQNSLAGIFLDSATTGDTACDQNYHYYCTGR